MKSDNPAGVKDLVSVIIPAYNQSNYLGLAIASVLEQTYDRFEVIIVDDGSTDDTKQVTLSFPDPRVHYYYQENSGLSAARNTGIRNSTGDFLTFLDSDDLFTPQKLELLIAEFDRNPKNGFAAGQAILIDENGRSLEKIFDTPPPQDPSDLLYWNPFHVSSVMVRRNWQMQAGFFDESLRAYEDWDMWLRLVRLDCPMGWVNQPVSLYRFHAQQMTQDRERMTTATFAVLSKTFADPTLPETWQQKKDLAYSNAYLRAAIQAYRVGDFQAGQMALKQSAHLDPRLAEDQGAILAKRLSALADSPKAADKLAFLERIYQNLPQELDALKRQKRFHLGHAAIELGFSAYERGNLPRARTSLLQAVRYQPRWLLNRGVLAILFRASILSENTKKKDISGVSTPQS